MDDKQKTVVFSESEGTEIRRRADSLNHAAAGDDSPKAKASTIDGRYEILEIIGRGGSGIVYRVRDRVLDDNVVALKLLLSALCEDTVFMQRFRRETTLARRLSHPNIVNIFDFGELPGRGGYLTMEYVDGESLSELLDRDPGGRLSWKRSLVILLEISLALDFAHRKQVIHRDVKPDNVFLTTNNSLKLGDFGTARHLRVDSKLTNTGEVIGTPGYMSPEHIRGEPPDARSDIYALGIMAFELVSGRLPFEASETNVMAVFTKQLNHRLPDLRELGIDIPDWYQDFVETCTEKRVADRFQTAGEVAGEIYLKLSALGMQPNLECLPASIQEFYRGTPRWSLSKFLRRL